MEALERKLEERDIAFDAADRQIMCYAHIINLSSGRVIRAASREKDASDSDSSESESEPANPIDHARGVVQAIRKSGKRREAFDEMVRLGNSKGWFKSGNPPRTVLLKELQLLRDASTRWDSVFLMLNRLREMRPV